MRTVTFLALAGLSLCAVTAAQAADLDYGVLRGPDYEPAAPVVDWGGLYFGAHGGYTSASLGFTNTAQPIVASYMRSTIIESEMQASTLLSPQSRRADGTSFGAYAGINFQFDETVLGIEADYTHAGIGNLVADGIARTKVTSDGYFSTVSLTSAASTKIEDYGTIRARAGYAIGSFLPFVTGGFAIGRAQVYDKVTVQSYAYDQATYKANQAITDGSAPAYVGRYGYSSFNQNAPASGVPNAPYLYSRTRTKVVGGITLGGGLEFELTQNIVLRGEYQYVLFNDFDGHKANINTVRGGAAVKF